MVQQWNVFKCEIEPQNDKNYIKIRTREDFQQDIQVLIREETVASHRGQGKISMTLYPVAVEVIDSSGTHLHALTYTGHKLDKSYVTVHNYMLKTIDYFEKMYGKKCISYDRMTDGCGSQFWAYGSYWSACQLLENHDNLERVVFNWYAPSEGKNLSDAIGGIIKNVMRRGIMMRKNTFSDKIELDIDNLGLIEVEEEEFETYENFFNWLNTQIRNREIGIGAKFKTFDLISLKEEDINKSFKVDENLVQKIPNLKLYHCFVALGEANLMFRLSTCTCPKCQNGKYNECDRDKIHGVWVKHSITKQGEVSTKANVTSYDSDYDDELQYDTEEEEDEESDGDECDRNEEDRLQKTIKYESTNSEGDYIIVSWYQKQYIGKIWDINQSELEATCKFMRRDFSYIHDQKLKFKNAKCG